MKILQVIPYFVPAYGYGGPIKVCFDVSRELAGNGHLVTVATTDVLDHKSRSKKPEEEIEKIKVVRFKNISNWLAKNFNGYLPIGFYSWARKNIKNFDIVYCHDFFTYQNIIVSHFCKKHKVPFIVQPHGTLSLVRQNARFSRSKKLFLKLFIHILDNSRDIIALTENEKKEIIYINKGLENKIKVIPNGIEPGEFLYVDKINLHKKYTIPKENKIIGYIGRIQYIKGIDISLHILSLIKDKIDFTYLIIGPDEGERKNLEKDIVRLGLKNNVVFTGILKGQEKMQTIKSCDLFLFTSRNEGLPVTVLETAALGIPQIISKGCNVPQISQYGAGFEFDLEQKGLFADTIAKTLSNAEKLQELSQNSLKMISGEFDIKKIYPKLQSIITS